MRTIIHTTTSTTTTLAPEAAAIGAEAGQRYSAWHSPVPYLFGGLAAMLGLIAFALLILACSYWRLSTDGTHHRDRDDDNDNDDEGRSLEGGYHGFSKTTIKVFEEKMVVIMAGDDKPTFLATPATLIFSNPHHHDSNSVIHDPNIACKCTTTSVDDDDDKPKQRHHHQITPTHI